MRHVIPARATWGVLIVDPHDDTRELYIDYFRWERVEVHAVRCGADALRFAARRTPDAVITCLRLPDMDGVDLCRRLHALPHAGGLRVIALGTSRGEYERAIVDGQFEMVVLKPCLPEVLLDSVRGALGASGAAGLMELSRAPASGCPD